MCDNLPSPSSPGDCENVAVEKVLKWRENVNLDKYIKCKILYDELYNITKTSDALDSELKEKIQHILWEQSTAQVVNLNSDCFNEASSTVLGLTHLRSSPLNNSESTKAQKVLQSTLSQSYQTICDQFFKVTGETITGVARDDVEDFKLRSDDVALFELKKKLEEQQKKYYENLLEKYRILEDLMRLRVDKLPAICENKITVCKLKTHMSELQSKIVQEKSRIDIFMEATNSLAAYKELLRDISEQQQECQSEIQYLQKLKKEYEQISCRQYDEILKSYIQYKTALAKKKTLYEYLNCKN